MVAQQQRHHQCIFKQTMPHASHANCACNLTKPRPHTECVFQHTATRKTTFTDIQNSDKSKFSNAESGTPPNHIIRSQTQPIPLYERPLLLRLQSQRLELFLQHGQRVMEDARHRPQVLSASSSPSPATSTPIVVAIERQSRQNPTAYHDWRLRSDGGFARTALAPG